MYCRDGWYRMLSVVHIYVYRWYVLANDSTPCPRTFPKQQCRAPFQPKTITRELAFLYEKGLQNVYSTKDKRNFDAVVTANVARSELRGKLQRQPLNLQRLPHTSILFNSLCQMPIFWVVRLHLKAVFLSPGPEQISVAAASATPTSYQAKMGILTY
jgi:hypothetical protein